MKQKLKVRLVTQCGCERKMTIYVDDDDMPPTIRLPMAQSMTYSYDEDWTQKPVNQKPFRTRTFRLSSVSGPNHPWIYYEEPDGQQ